MSRNVVIALLVGWAVAYVFGPREFVALFRRTTA